MPKKETTRIVCVAEFRAFDGKTEELIAALHSLIEPTHKEPGCLRYELNQRSDDTPWITFIEKWKDRTLSIDIVPCPTSNTTLTMSVRNWWKSLR